MKNSLRVPLIAMIAAILVIVSFQSWWLWQTYKEQGANLRKSSGDFLREAVWEIQDSKLKLDSNIQRLSGGGKDVTRMMWGMQLRMQDTSAFKDVKKKIVLLNQRKIDDAIDTVIAPNVLTVRDKMDELLIAIDQQQDSLSMKQISDSVASKFKKENISVSFVLSKDTSQRKRDVRRGGRRNEVTIGIAHPVTYRLLVQNEVGFLLKKLFPQILFSLFLIGITAFSFSLLYKNLRHQQKLTELKNDFINNITHELKTPIATVSVAIEALKNFNAMHDPVRTQEYLDISGNELNRLSMLVDKVLKMSMFEKKELELKKEPIALDNLVKEVTRSMQLQFERVHAKVDIHVTGSNFTINADKLHITNLVYNLLDNALKYGKEKDPVMEISIEGKESDVLLQVKDNGIGISSAHKDKIFDKFFRVPHGNTHNIKGYGLGLSYVAQVVKEHAGKISVISEEGKGSTFKVNLPRQ